MKLRIVTNGRAFKVQMRFCFIWFSSDEEFDTYNGAKQSMERELRLAQAERLKWTVVDDKKEGNK